MELLTPVAPPEPDEGDFLLRAGVALFGVAAVLGLLGCVAAGLSPPEAPVTWGTIVVAGGVVAMLRFAGSRLPPWWPHVAVVIATINTSLSAITDVQASSALEAGAMLFFVWMGLFVGYFCSVRAAVIHLSLIATAIGVPLLMAPPPGGAVQAWLLLAGTVAGASFIVRAQQAQVESARRREAAWARTDLLTGLPNRRALNERFTYEHQRARRSNAPLTLILADLDHFKRLNDSHGHDAGDDALRAVGQLLRRTCRASELPARLGGEEFAVLLPATTLQDAREVGERLRSAVVEAFADSRTPLTISVGVASCAPLHIELGPALEQADRALYLAKRSGRNRVVVGHASIGAADMVVETHTA